MSSKSYWIWHYGDSMKKISTPWLKIGVTVLMVLYTTVLYLTPMDCPFKAVFGIPCPGCGLTRAWISALQFKFSDAFSYHFMFWSIPVLYLCFLFDGKLFKRKWANCLFYTAVLAGFVINWIVHL